MAIGNKEDFGIDIRMKGIKMLRSLSLDKVFELRSLQTVSPIPISRSSPSCDRCKYGIFAFR
jgi:hypothetical protein